MTCDQCRAMVDAYLAGELPVDSSQDVITHLESCDGCRAEVEARQALRHVLRNAFARSTSLAADEAFLAQVRARLKHQHERAQRRFARPAWLAIAASVVLVIGLGWALMWVVRAPSTIDWAGLAAHAAGDHRYCALQHALDEAPIPLEEAARRYDPRYGRIREVVETSGPVRDGDVEVLGAHACIFKGRRFAHVVVRRRDRVMSILVTEADVGQSVAAPSAVTACGPADGFQVACSGAGGYTVFVVSDLSPDEHLTLARALSTSLHHYLTGA
jgi:anti-sigma factor RsiW